MENHRNLKYIALYFVPGVEAALKGEKWSND